MIKYRRFLWIAGVAAVAVLVGLVAVYPMRDRGPILYDNFAKIDEGMTLVEVEAILGCPPGDYRSGEVVCAPPIPDGVLPRIAINYWGQSGPTEKPGATWHQWIGDRGRINIVFDDETGKFVSKDLVRGRRTPTQWWLAIEIILGIVQ